MNDTEKRRIKLLEQTRNLYRDDRMIPAVHPRYGASYHHLYAEKMDLHKGTFGIRCIFCVIIFCVYVMMGKNNQIVFGIKDLQVREIIMHNEVLELY